MEDAKSRRRSKQALVFEVVTVLSVTLLPVFANSLEATCGEMGSNAAVGVSTQAIRLGVLHHLVSLLLVAYIIYHSGDSRKHFGLEFRPSVLWISTGLFLGGLILRLGGYYAFRHIGSFDIAPQTGTGNIEFLRDTPIALSMGYVVTASAFEEFLVRAYFMTRLRDLGWSTTGAILLSTLVQSSYHMYQGPLAMASNIPMFLLFSIYFARYRNAPVVVLAHLYMNVLARTSS